MLAAVTAASVVIAVASPTEADFTAEASAEVVAGGSAAVAAVEGADAVGSSDEAHDLEKISGDGMPGYPGLEGARVDQSAEKGKPAWPHVKRIRLPLAPHSHRCHEGMFNRIGIRIPGSLLFDGKRLGALYLI